MLGGAVAGRKGIRVGLLVSLLWLVASIAIADRSPRPWVQAVAVVMAGIAGTTLPDLDLLLPIGHRSGLTHSLLPLALALFATRWRPDAGRCRSPVPPPPAADSFPNAMRGYATVKLPWAGSIGATASYAWLGGQAVVASVAGAVLLAAALPLRIAMVAAALLAAIGIAYLFATDGGWPALAIYAAFGWLAVRRRAT